MNRIIERYGKLFLMPENREIPSDSVLGINYIIRKVESSLKRLEKEVEANRKTVKYLRQKSIQGTITANESVLLQERILEESIFERNNLEKEIEDLKSNLEIAEEENKGNVYFYKDGKRQMSDWDFLQTTGTLEGFEKKGFPLNPTHDFNLLKPARLTQYETAKQDFIEERNINHLETTDFELNLLYLSWLNKELDVIESWLGTTNGEKKRQQTISDQIEILKYKNFVTSEIKRTEMRPEGRFANIAEIKKESNPFSDAYNDMYTIRNVKEHFSKVDSKVITWKNPGVKDNFDLMNLDIYDLETGELIRRGTQTDYNSEFLVKFDILTILQVEPFLDHQYDGSKNKKAFITYLKHAALHSKIIDHEGIKGCIRDWLERYEQDNLAELIPQQSKKQDIKPASNYKAKHYVLTYLFDCSAKRISFPVGQKNDLERIGNKVMGVGKGNTFYKNFNLIISKDINVESNLVDIAGENWRKIILELSSNPEILEEYLKSKQL